MAASPDVAILSERLSLIIAFDERLALKDRERFSR
jgi:hypothetical protein